jgi:hypothetical protein
MAQIGPGDTGANVAYGITAATVVKAAPATLYAIAVTTAGTADGAVYDSDTATAQNQIGAIPSAAGNAPYVYNWRCENGIYIVPPTGGTVAVSFV